MQSEGTSEKAPIAPMQMSQSAIERDYAPSSGARQIRTILLILLAIHMALAWVYFLEQIIGLIQYYNVPKDIRDYNAAFSYISNVVFGAILILYLAIYIFAVFQYARIPILVAVNVTFDNIHEAQASIRNGR
ncbi:unnamed protein product [Rotaria sp. Silwood1]|nr:unnamed protein product [Rotaria sp. Silwood1]CAF1656473.1 unnamed protein product [Rotaria sp. Silwood1]CAF4900109.1 unnamed protein product [Rotaria sp. Silwood1]CAF4901193.1 unnamed protein product [Rotaria sp. Silwood1]